MTIRFCDVTHYKTQPVAPVSAAATFVSMPSYSEAAQGDLAMFQLTTLIMMHASAEPVADSAGTALGGG